MSRFVRCAVAAALATLALGATAQQRAPAGNGGTPRAPTGIQVAPLGAGPFLYKTAEGQDIRVVVHTRGLVRPWSLVWLPSGEMLVTERGGALRIVRNGVLDPQPVTGLPEVRAQGLSGLFDVALHPQFATNRFVYLSYNKPIAERQNGLGVARGVFNGHALTDVRDIFVTTDTSSVSRLAFGRDGKLYVTTFGNAGDGANAQNPMSHAGKVLRLNDDGSVPGDNPFSGNPGYKPEIYTLGHRSTLALVVNPDTGELWENENGPNGGDEINILKPGANYGWPLVSTGRSYPGPWQSKGFSREGFEDPVVYWMPSIAASGMAFYTGSKLAEWTGDVFVGGMRMGEIPGTGHLQRIQFNDNWEELRREMLLVDLRQRIRDVRQGPDELLYLLTDENDGTILRIEPANCEAITLAVEEGLRVNDNVTIPAAEIELTAIRSQGAGGQNVNKVASAVQLRFDVVRSSALPPGARERLLALRDHRISSDGVVVIKAQQFRSQEQNKAAAFERLADLVRRALVVPKVRRATRPTRASQARRLDSKAKHARRKRERRTLDD